MDELRPLQWNLHPLYEPLHLAHLAHLTRVYILSPHWQSARGEGLARYGKRYHSVPSKIGNIIDFQRRRAGAGMPFTWKKRQRKQAGSSSTAQDDDSVEMVTFFERALELTPSVFTFDSDSLEEKTELARRCWERNPIISVTSLCTANPELASILKALITNTYRPVDAEVYELRQYTRVEGVLSNLMRMQSQKQFTLLTARISLAAYRAQLPRMLWHIIHAFAPGILASFDWTHRFVEFAVPFRPACKYEELALVGGTMFDNYSRKVLYKSQATNDSAGYQLNMTNWASMTIPKLVAPANFDAHANCT